MRLEDIKEKAIDFYDYDINQQEDILDEIFKIASTGNKQEFIDDARKLFPQFEMSGIGVIYEALTKDPKAWGSFFVGEFKRAFKDAEGTHYPFDTLTVLDEIGMMPRVNYEFAHDIIKLLAQYINHHEFVFQHRAIILLGDWLGNGNANKHLALLQTLENCSVNNSNWKIRYVCYTTLWENNKHSDRVKLSFMDRIRSKFQDPYSI